MTTETRLKIGFTIALLATTISLFFSEIMNLPPCSLCWYQRIFMYPLVLIFGVGLLTADHQALVYAKALSISGLLIAAYHCLLYYGILPETVAPCKSGVSCTQKQIELVGFLTIPLLSLGSFLVLSIICTSKSTGMKNEK